MNTWKRWLSLALCLALCFGMLPVTAGAADEGAKADAAPTEAVSDVSVITDFVCPRELLAELTWDKAERPTVELLASEMPDSIDVLLDGETEPVSIPVTWYPIGQDYELGNSAYYQFCPVWDESLYALDVSLDCLRDAPYVGVFFSAEAGELSLLSSASSVEARVYEFLTEAVGLNTAAACGILANISAESAFNPSNLQNSYEQSLGYTDATYTAAVDNGSYTNFVYDAAGYGLCQWTYWSRKEGLLNLARSRSVSISDLEMQLAYMRSEWSASTLNYLKSISDTADGAYDVASYYCLNCEKPANMENQAVIRGNLAKNTYWAKYGIENVQLMSNVPDGMGPRVISGGKRDLKWPVPGQYKLQSDFYDRRDRSHGLGHAGLDFAAPNGSTVVASYDGTVIAIYSSCTHNYGKQSSNYCGCGGGFGNNVLVKHTYTLLDGSHIELYTRYAHLSSVAVSNNQQVSKGAKIGTVGSTGNSGGFHLHFHTYYGGTNVTNSVDPYANDLLELPSGIIVTDSLPCGQIYMDQVKAQYANPIGSNAHVHAEIKKGSSGTCVSELQTLLNQRIGAGLTVDGVFGTATENALKTFQSQNGLAADGICGPNTWAALEAPPSSGCSCSESYAGNYTVTTASDALNIRSAHDSSSSIVGAIPKGATVYVSKGDGTWAHVEYNGVSGYASMTYLTREVAKYTLDVNGWLDGGDKGNIDGYGTFDITIGGETFTGQTDWFAEYPDGTYYKITNIRSVGDHTYLGVYQGDLEGTIHGGVNIKLSFQSNPSLDINGWLDGNYYTSVVGYGKFSIRINDGWSHGNEDFYHFLPPGTTYELYNIVPNPGYTFNGFNLGSRIGTLYDNTEIILNFSRIDTSGISAPVNSVSSNGVTYSYYNTPVTWYTAKQFCEEQGGHLATISSEAEHNVIKEMLGNTTAWLGATDNSGTWQWVTGEPFDYAPWNGGEPNDAPSVEGGENYLEYYGGVWNDRDGCTLQGFVMESASVSERILPDGNYIIANAGTEDKSTFNFLDIGGGDYPAKDFENVNIWGPCSDDLAEYDVWTLTYVDGFYTITQYGTDMALTVQNGSSQAGDNACVRPNNWWDSQRWTITPNYRDGYRLTAKCSGLSLDLDGGNVAPGTNVRQWEPNDGTAQSWLFMPYRPEQPIANGRYMLISTIADGLELDVVGNSGDLPDNTNVQLWDTSTHNQYNSFDVIALDNGYYKLIHAASGKALDVLDGVSTLYGNIAVHEDNGSNAQQWAITRNGDGYLLRARCSGLALDVDGGMTMNGTNIRQYYWNGSAAQTWLFAPAEHTVSYDANGGTGAPAAQTKYFNNALTLSDTLPTRNGYTFLGWSKDANATAASYSAGGWYEEDTDATLYAVWQSKEVYLDVNGWLDGGGRSNTEDYGTFDVWVKPVGGDWDRIRHNAEDICAPLLYGTEYRIDNIQPIGNHVFHGVHYGSLTGTITENVSVSLNFRTIEDIGSDFYARIVNQSLNLALTNNDEGDVVGRSSDNSAAQVWYFARQSDGFYKITSLKDGKNLDVLSESNVSESNVHVYNDGNYASMLWAVHYSSESNAYLFGVKSTESILDIDTSNQNILVYPDDGSSTHLFSIEKLNKYSVQFNANGGSGAPASQTKLQGVALTLNGTIPTREGYDFLGWAENSSATSAQYPAGGSFTKDADATLYAVWQSNPMSVIGVSLNNSTLSLTVGASETLTATVNPSNAANQAVSWTTSNSSVATVSNGKVTAVGAGTATITVTTADGGKTATCDVTVTPEPETDQTVIRVGTGTAYPNQTVTIPVSIENNSGIAGAALTVSYDSSVLTLDAIEKGDVFAKGAFTSDKSRGLIQWYYTDTNEDITAEGTLFTLSFSVSATAAEGSYAVSVACKDGESANLSNMNSDTVSARFVAGAVSVTVGVKGDVTGDNKVLMNDVVKLARSVAGYVTLTERENTLGDVTGDGKVLMNDVVKVARYVAGFITTLEPSVSLLGVSESAVIEAGTVSCEAGETISVPVMITQNPGIAGAMLEIQYDANALTLTGIERGEVLGKGSFTGDLNTGIIQWYYIDENSNTTATGCLFTLHFTVKDGASGNYPVTVQIRDQEPANLSDIDAEPVAVQFSAGGVQVGNAPSVALSAVAEGESSVRVTLTNAPDCAGAYCAVYAANGQMLGMRNLSTTGGTQTLTIPCNGGSAAVVKVFFTDGTFRPTEKAVECPVK